MATLMTIVGHVSIARAQGVEASPFYGYRFGGDFFELTTGQPVDLDGAPAVGIVVNVPLRDGLQVEGFFTHQKGDVLVPSTPAGPAGSWQIAVDHMMGGGLQEFGRGRVRPFATGMLGLTRYAVSGDSEIRFSVAAGTGVKIFPTPRLGVRLDGRAFATIVDAQGSLIACSVGVCLVSMRVNMAWQAEFTAGLIVRFP